MRFLTLLILLSLAACGRPGSAVVHRESLGPNVAAPDPRVGCNMRVEAPWRGANGYNVVADAVGVTCGEASVSLTIAGPDGGTHMAANYQIAQLPAVFGDDAARAGLDRDGMARMLTRWTDPNAPLRRMAHANDLPPWPHRQDQPRDAQHAYTPGHNISRATYESLRHDRRPLFCYEAEARTLKCSALLSDGTVVLMATARAAS